MISSPRRRLVAGLAALAVLAGAVTLWRSGASSSSASPSGDSAVPIATSAVVRTDLASTTQLSGTLGYASSYTVINQGSPGTLTALPEPGAMVTEGHPVFEIDGRPVPLFYGSRPAWRGFAPGMTPGPDVLQLETDLVEMGYASPRSLSLGQSYSEATAAAVRRWQRATGQTATGTIALGAFSFEPGPLRVAATSAALGAVAQPGAVILTATSSSPVVNMAVPAGQTFLVHAGDTVTVTLPAGNTTPGRVVSVSTVASSGDPSTPGAPPAGQSGAGTNPTVPALVSLTDPSAAAGLDEAPVTVNVTDQVVRNILAVPITALVALVGGGYGVYVDSGPAGRRLVAVNPGLFATTLVQVTGPGLSAGDLVEVPSQ